MKPSTDILPAHRTQAIAMRVQKSGGNTGDAIPRPHHLLKTGQVHQVGESVLHKSAPFTYLGRKGEMRPQATAQPNPREGFKRDLRKGEMAYSSQIQYTPKEAFANPG